MQIVEYTDERQVQIFLDGCKVTPLFGDVSVYFDLKQKQIHIMTSVGLDQEADLHAAINAAFALLKAESEHTS